MPLIYLPILLQSLALGITAAGSPGAFQTYLIHQTLEGGWRRGALVALAPLASDPPMVLAALFLLERLPEGFLRYVSLLGGLFVLYLAWGLGRRWRAAGGEVSGGEGYGGASAARPYGDEAEARPAGVFWRAAAMNLLNPGPYMFWMLVLGPLLLAALRQSLLLGLVFLLGFYGALIGGMLGLAALFHLARRFGPRATRTLSLASILILVVFGVLLVWRGMK